MPKTRQQKEQEVERLVELLRSAPSGALATLEKLKVKDEWRLREVVRSTGGTLKVVKKNLLKFALKELDVASEWLEGIRGTLVIAAGKDGLTIVKEAVKFAKSSEAFKVMAGFLREGEVTRILSKEEVRGIAALPSREELIARAIGSIRAPLSGLMGVMNGVSRSLVQVLSAIQKQKSN